MARTVAEVLYERCRVVVSAPLEPVAARTARHCVLDWMGVALAGSQTRMSTILGTVTRDGSTEASLIGHDDRVSVLGAALVNGTAGHALDFDDMHPLMAGHPSAAILPAVFALAERERLGGEAVLEALVVGVEAACALGALVNPAHYDAGWHATGTLGSLGAAAACAHLLRLGPEGWATALGLAATQAAGMRVMFGTMAKPLHAGRAAQNGLLAAELAAAGYGAAPDALGGPAGFLRLYGGVAAREELAPSSGRPAIDDVLFKYHATCFMTHSSIINARRLVEEYGVTPDDVKTVELTVSPELRGLCDIAAPSTPEEAKFSLQATTAMALLGDDTSTESTFREESIRRPALVSLRDRVSIRFDASADGRPTWSAMRLVTREGSTLEAETDANEPERNLGRREERLIAKFRSLASRVLEPLDVRGIESELLGSCEAPVTTILALAANPVRWRQRVGT
jgi:2-methylcitrate dehydratase PrpD